MDKPAQPSTWDSEREQKRDMKKTEDKTCPDYDSKRFYSAVQILVGLFYCDKVKLEITKKTNEIQMMKFAFYFDSNLQIYVCKFEKLKTITEALNDDTDDNIVLYGGKQDLALYCLRNLYVYHGPLG